MGIKQWINQGSESMVQLEIDKQTVRAAVPSVLPELNELYRKALKLFYLIGYERTIDAKTGIEVETLGPERLLSEYDHGEDPDLPDSVTAEVLRYSYEIRAKVKNSNHQYGLLVTPDEDLINSASDVEKIANAEIENVTVHTSPRCTDPMLFPFLLENHDSLDAMLSIGSEANISGYTGTPGVTPEKIIIH